MIKLLTSKKSKLNTLFMDQNFPSQLTIRKKTFLSFAIPVLIFVFLSQTAFSQSVVAEYGRLTVTGNKVTSQDGSPISLAGNSIFWSNFSEGAKFYNAETVNHLAGEDWQTDIVRAAMGVEDFAGFITNPEQEKAKVIAVVDAAIAAGVYVIIDWHSHNAEDYEQQAIQFFSEMSARYANSPNVIYEVYNEPIEQSWPEIKNYAENVIDAIRANDPDNLIIVGTPFFSQRVVDASLNPINGSNIAYTLHFYAGTHRQSLRNNATTAMNNGIALFVTEWGAVNANGDGSADIAETNLWMDFLRNNNISHANWSVSDKAEGASVVASGTGVSGLTSNNLTTTGFFIQDIIKNWNDISTNPGDEQTAFQVQNIPGRIEAENYDNGGQGVAYNDTSSGNSGSALRNDDVDKQPTSDTGGGHNVGWIADGEWLEYTVSNIESGIYDITFRVASPRSHSKSVEVSLDGTNLGSVSVPNTGGWQNWQDITLTNVTIPAGSNQVLRVTTNGGLFNINYVDFIKNTIIPPTEDNYIIRARGTSGEEQLQLSINGTPIQTFNLTRNFQEYSVSSDLTGTPRITYVNDSFTRDAEVDWLQVNGVTLQAENQPVNTSVYQNGSCGGSFSQEMHCPGYIDFTNNSSANFADTSATIQEENVYTVYPNPTRDIITISSGKSIDKNSNITLLNTFGTVIDRKKLESTSTFNLSNLSAGVYFAIIENNGVITQKTIIKQ